LEDSAISVPVHDAKFGHPVGFGRDFGPALALLAGEKGAKRLFAGAMIKQITVDDPGVLWDIDVPAALDFTLS
jgi:molybdenum cofactor cytidylyltransferase